MPKLIFPPFNEKYIRSTPYSPGKCFMRMYGAGIVYPDPRYEFTKVRDNWLFEYIVSGSGFLECGDVTVKLSKGDCIVIPKGVPTHYGADKKDPYVKLWFSVNGDYVQSLFDAFMPSGTEFLVRNVNVYSIFEKVLSELEKEGEDDIGICTHAMLDIMLAVSAKSTAEPASEQTKAANLKQYIDTFLQEKIVLRKASEHLGITERTATKLFRERYGITPTKYIRKARLESARQLLESTDKTVSDIAHTLHYCDQSYFSTDFKKEFGLYPSDYRESILKAKK